MTLNGVMAVILRYFSEFGYLPGVLRKSSRSLSHLLMSSCILILPSLLIRNRGHRLAFLRTYLSAVKTDPVLLLIAI